MYFRQYQKAKRTVWFNFETNKFEIFNFETEEEMLLFFDDKLSKFKNEKEMNYAIELIEREISLLERCLSAWECKEYPDAKKQRDKLLNELNEALNILTNK